MSPASSDPADSPAGLRHNRAMRLDISSDERSLLIGMLERALSETRVEVRRTTTPDFHDQLQAEEHQLAALLERLRGLAGT
jgi:hypothetical protein